MSKESKRNRDLKHGARHSYTPLSHHIKKGSLLKSPLKDKLPFQLWDWQRDLLPEYLWIAVVVHRFGKGKAYKFYYAFMDAVDEVWPDKDSVPFGLMTDFGLIPPPAREQLWKSHQDMILEYFDKPMAGILASYPDNPAAWLIKAELLDDARRGDPGTELERLRYLVTELYPRRGEYATEVQALAFGRLLHHGKIQFGENVADLLPILEKYPVGCTDAERVKVESMVRSLMGGLYMRDGRYGARDWPKYFWRRNRDLAACHPMDVQLEGSQPLTPEEGQQLHKVLQRNARRARGYLAGLSVRAKYDLYDPQRDEVLLGLFARIVRLYVLMTEDPNLWARDMAGILLRCLTDSAITFRYLVTCGQDDDFERFRKYGEGQQKLLLLHLQDSYPQDKSLDGQDAEAVAEELGWWAPEFLDIELGHWAKKETRSLAQAAGMEKFYRLVYGPTSGELHGSWVSLKHSNLCRCAEPLHRFHRLPSYTEPPLFVETILASQELFSACLQTGVDALGFPVLDDPLESLISTNFGGERAEGHPLNRT